MKQGYRTAAALGAIAALFPALAQAQTVITGTVADGTDLRPLRAFVSVFGGDSLLFTSQAGANGAFSFQVEADSVYTVASVMEGYEDAETTLRCDTLRTPLRLLMVPAGKTGQLGELVVESNRDMRVEQTANGEVFWLSDKARSMRNPYEALAEIPALNVNTANQSITTKEGAAPLILINGERVNSGIAPLLPSNMESVEVVRTVSARYLQSGVSAIVNIRLKKKIEPYVWLEAATRHDVPLYQGFGVGYFEIGGPRFSIYGRGAYDYTHHGDMESEVSSRNTGYTLDYSSHMRTNSHDAIGELLMKWRPAENDYLALHGYYTHANSTANETAEGTMTAATPLPYSYVAGSRNTSDIVTSSLYYRHIFSDNNTLEATLAYNHNGNDLDNSRLETTGAEVQNILSDFHNRRNSGSLDIDYSKTFPSGFGMGFGSHTSMRLNRIRQLSAGYPTFRYNDVNEYLYGYVNGRAGKFMYMLSAGMEGMWMKPGEATSRYWRPSTSESVTWLASNAFSLKVSHTLSNSAPNISMLNPYNTSTDPLVVRAGNPHLKPDRTHLIGMGANISWRGFYISPSLRYDIVSDMAASYGYTENGVYHDTYGNLSRFSKFHALINVSRVFGPVITSAGGRWTKYHYPGFSDRDGFYAYFRAFTRVRSWLFVAYMSFETRDVSRLSTTRHYTPGGYLQVQYNFTPDFYIAGIFNSPYGERRTRTVTDAAPYHCDTRSWMKEDRFHLSILLRYTFRTNLKNKIKLDNVVTSKEKGINLQR